MRIGGEAPGGGHILSAVVARISPRAYDRFGENSFPKRSTPITTSFHPDPRRSDDAQAIAQRQ
jgi:hypothetical protein